MSNTNTAADSTTFTSRKPDLSARFARVGQSIADAAEPVNNVVNGTQPASELSEDTTEVIRELFKRHPEEMRKLVMQQADRAVRKHKIRTAIKYAGVGGIVALIGYGAFRLSRAS